MFLLYWTIIQILSNVTFLLSVVINVNIKSTVVNINESKINKTIQKFVTLVSNLMATIGTKRFECFQVAIGTNDAS